MAEEGEFREIPFAELEMHNRNYAIMKEVAALLDCRDYQIMAGIRRLHQEIKSLKRDLKMYRPDGPVGLNLDPLR